MRQFLVLSTADWLTLQRGGSIPLQLGATDFLLVAEPGVPALLATNSENGATAPIVRRNRKRYTYYTLEEKRAIIENVDAARRVGTNLKVVCAKHGIHNSLYYHWRKALLTTSSKRTKKGS